MATGKLKINLFGESWKLKKICPNEEQINCFEVVAQRMKLPLALALADPYFYYLLKDDTIQSIDDIAGKVWSGLLNTPKNQIEIWFRNYKIQKIKINDLLQELLLFPLYNTEILENTLEQEKGIFFVQKEIGLIGKYDMMIVDFRIDDLIFQLSNNNLHNITYKGQNFKLIKSDTLLTYQNSYKL